MGKAKMAVSKVPSGASVSVLKKALPRAGRFA